jgi:hypothetical protein
MSQQFEEMKRWVKTGIIAGILADVTYIIAISINLPLKVTYPIFWLFGPCLIVGVLGIYHFIKHHQTSIMLQVGILFLIISGAISVLMAAMQGALRIVFTQIPHSDVGEMREEAWTLALKCGDAIQLGADMAYDVFMLGGVLLLGIAMLKHPRFGKLFGWPAIVLGTGGLVLNTYSFPIPPGEAGLFDGGPLVGLWFLIVVIQMIRSLRWLNNSRELV